MDHYPIQLSGGEQQRVALARAFSTRPRYPFADEPTGSLDTATGRGIERLLEELNGEAGTTLVLVTHEAELAARAHRLIRLSGGRLAGDLAAWRASASFWRWPGVRVVPRAAGSRYLRPGSRRE